MLFDLFLMVTALFLYCASNKG